MRRPSSLFPIFTKTPNNKQRSVWPYLLLASLKSIIPETLRQTTPKPHTHLSSPLLHYIQNNNTNTNNTIENIITNHNNSRYEKSKEDNWKSIINNNSRCEFRRRKEATGGSGGGGSRENTSKEEVEEDISDIQSGPIPTNTKRRGISQTNNNNHVLSAYQKWSEQTGECTANEFMKGAQQSYYSLGVLLGTLAEATRPHLASGKAISLGNALQQLKVLLTKHYEVSPTVEIDSETNNNNSKNNVTDVKSDKIGHQTVHSVAQTLMQILPISSHLAETIFHIWNKQRSLEANLFCVAGPTDYILSSNMILFHDCHSTKETHFADGSLLTINTIPSTKNIENNNKESESIINDDSNKTTSTQPNENTETSNNNNNNNNNKSKGQTITIAYKGQSLPPIPENAIACVIATIDVVTPPQRYCPAFEWFYQRLTGYESEYERIAAARIFAMSNFRPHLLPLDFIMRMFTGKQLRIACVKEVSELIGIPKNIRECPPATRKLLCFYLDVDKKWVLSDLFTVDSVLTTGVPSKTAAA